MATWFIVLLGLYIVGFIGFTVAVYYEAPKHNSRINAMHILVALIWPLWLIWYLVDITWEKIRRK